MPLVMYDPFVDGLVSKAPDTRSGRIIRSLCAVYPGSITGKQLMGKIGLAYHSDPVRSFTRLCISFSQANQVLHRAGLQAVRTGGTPDDFYRLTPSAD